MSDILGGLNSIRDRESLEAARRDVARLTTGRDEARQRAASWWEAAKTLNRWGTVHRELHQQARAERDALRTEIRAVLDGWRDPDQVLEDIREILDREPATRCVNDTNGDGDCVACARNPNALCRQPIDSQSEVQP